MKIQSISFFVRKLLLILAFAGFSTSNVLALQLATWNFAGWNPTKVTRTTAAPTTTSANVIVSNLTMGAGLDGSELYFSDNAFCGSQMTATTLAQAIANNEYYEFTIQSVAPKQLSIASIDVSALCQGQVTTFALMSSIKGFTSAAGNVISSITTGPDNNWNIPTQSLLATGHVSLTTAVTFRIYIYAATNQQWTAFGFGGHAAPATCDFAVMGVSDQPDLNPPTTPGSLAAVGVGATNLKLTWTASTDDNGVVGYDIKQDGVLIGSTTTKLFYNILGLTPSTAYTFTVTAKDATAKNSTPASVLVTTAAPGSVGGLPQLPIGMNLPSLEYYTTALPFTDAMTSSGDMFTTYPSGPWNSEKISEIPRDANGYPTTLPFSTSDGKSSIVRFLLNDYYSGRYVLTFTGAGTISISGCPTTKLNNNKYYVDFTGLGGNVWLDILQSTTGNYLKDFKILPLTYDGLPYPTFNPKYLDGLRPFHALRFMDWIKTNGSSQNSWATHIPKTYYTQAGSRGASYEYAIELCNELDCDAWVTVPHAADDNFITQTARLWRDGLRPNRKVYAEYSNEIWNWMFTQSGYIANDKAAGHANAYVTTDLTAIKNSGGNFLEMDAYMMARNFRLWKAEFTGSNAARLVRTAAVQHAWTDNTRRILDYLFDVDGQGCDMVSPGGYFNFKQADHDRWVAPCPTPTVTAAQICDETLATYDANEAVWTNETAALANSRGVGYVVYEGGQHMQPWMQGDWCYNQAVWDAQINPKMYQLYVNNFTKMTDPVVNCSLFMAFSYMGSRQSKYGSWGHLESMSQVGNPGGYMTIAPKYQALLDCNSAKNLGITTVASPSQRTSNEIRLYPNPSSEFLNLV